MLAISKRSRKRAKKTAKETTKVGKEIAKRHKETQIKANKYKEM